MSKQARKGRATNLPAAAYETPLAAPRPAAPAGERPAAPAPVAVRTVNWQAEYGDILNDLKRTGVIAGIMLAIMIALSFVL